MQFTFTEEQNQFRDIVARFCRDKSPTPVIRNLMETDAGFDPQVWRQMCQELGLVGIHVPEERGGSGFGAVELGIVMEEMGRALLPSPYLACSVLACSAVAEIDDSATRDPLMASMVQGEKVGTLILDSRHGNPVSELTTSSDDKLSGTCGAVLDAGHADFLLAITPSGEHNTLYLVEASAPGVSVAALRPMDLTRRQAAVTLDNAAATKLGDLSETQVKRIYDTALVALANEMIGGAQALLDSAVAYTKMRVQFGRTIGSFQAIKHRLADLLVDVELARAGACQAAQALASGEDVSSSASLAKFTASDAYLKAALECIQFHGGIGFTWENDTHLWFRRAKSSEVLLGTQAFHRERYLQEMNV